MAWPRLRDLVEDDPDIGREIIENATAHPEFGSADDLSSEMLGEVVTALGALFPPADDAPLQAGAGYVTPRQQALRLRDGLLSVLASRGADGAVDTIEALVQEHGANGILGVRLNDAREARRSQWPAPSPGEIVRLAMDHDARIVQSDEHLQKLIVASLGRAERVLQGTPPRVWELWNEKPLTPKSEGALSDWVAAWLTQDLKVGGRLVGRELEVRPSATGKGIGESVDLHVSAPGGEFVADAVTLNVRIEVKGCWNAEVDTALIEQLAKRYLQPGGIARGIYLVGHYAAGDWADGDWRRTKCRSYDAAEALDRYSVNAAAAMADLGVHIVPVILDLSIKAPRTAS